MTVKEISETADLSEPARQLVKEDSTPEIYLDSLEKQELFQDAIRFMAFKLPIDAGIKWASACIKDLRSPESKQQKDEPLDATDQWVKAKGDPTRWAAKDAADKAKTPGPSNLVAMAVYMSGGSMSPPGSPETPPPPNVAQMMVAGAVQVIVVSHEPQKANERYKKALAMGKALDAPGK